MQRNFIEIDFYFYFRAETFTSKEYFILSVFTTEMLKKTCSGSNGDVNWIQSNLWDPFESYKIGDLHFLQKNFGKISFKIQLS